MKTLFSKQSSENFSTEQRNEESCQSDQKITTRNLASSHPIEIKKSMERDHHNSSDPTRSFKSEPECPIVIKINEFDDSAENVPMGEYLLLIFCFHLFFI